MRAIYAREMKAYFNTMTGYIFMTIFLLVGGLFFSNTNLMGENAQVTSVLNNLQYILLIITPVLTMRLLAEERKAKTDQMLLTAPISIRSIVAGKFLSAISVFLITILISFIYPIILAILGTPSWGEIVTGYLGLLLFGGALISVGMFISSLTQSQVTAAVATLGVMLCILLTEMMIPQIGNEALRTTLSKATLSYNIYYFQRGIISLASLVYYLSFIFLFLFLTSRMVERRRWAKG